MTEPTRGTINKNVLKAVDLAIENQKEINKQFEQLIMMTQAQAVATIRVASFDPTSTSRSSSSRYVWLPVPRPRKRPWPRSERW